MSHASKAQELELLRLRVTELENEINSSKRVTTTKEKSMHGSQSVPLLLKTSDGGLDNSLRRRRRKGSKSKSLGQKDEKPAPAQSNSADFKGSQDAGFLPSIGSVRNIRSADTKQLGKEAAAMHGRKQQQKFQEHAHDEASNSASHNSLKDLPQYGQGYVSRNSRMRRSGSEQRMFQGKAVASEDLFGFHCGKEGNDKEERKKALHHRNAPPPIIFEEEEDGASQGLSLLVENVGVDSPQEVPLVPVDEEDSISDTAAASPPAAKQMDLTARTAKQFLLRVRKEFEETGGRSGQLAEHRALVAFGVRHTELVQKLEADGVVSGLEAKLVLALVEAGHAGMTHALFHLERQGLQPEAVRVFRTELTRILERHVQEAPAAAAAAEEEEVGWGDEEVRRRRLSADARHPRYRRPSLVPRNLRKIAARLNQLADSPRPRLLLVGSGTFNPPHKLHLRLYYVARRFLEERADAEVVGGVVSPTHPTMVRQKYRTRPREIVPPRHRLAMARLAVGDSSWLSVDPWEITRRRIMDYVSVLDHVASALAQFFPQTQQAAAAGGGAAAAAAAAAERERVRILYLCKGNAVLKLNPEVLREKGYMCVVVCRPLETERLLKMMGRRWAGVAHVVEDRAILSHQLERTCSHRVRQELIKGNPVDDMTGEAVYNYMLKHRVGEKMAGALKWNRQDNDFTFAEDEEKPYANSPAKIVRPEHELPLQY